MSPIAFSTTRYFSPNRTEPTHREYVAVSQFYRCHYCNRHMDLGPIGDAHQQNSYTCTVEHVLPRGRGGTNDLSNKVASCYRCNTLRNHIEQHLMGHGNWIDVDVPLELFMKLLPVDIERWTIYNPLKLASVIEHMRWGREAL